MSYRTMFPKRHTFLAVVHVQDYDQAVRNVRIAITEGADGVFLIGHAKSPTALWLDYQVVRREFPDTWIGLNWLRYFNQEAIANMCPSMNGLWTDHAVVYEDADRTALHKIVFNIKREEWERSWRSSFLFFGGVAFKYQEPVEDPAGLAKIATRYVDVVTTSGDGTGIAPDVEKLRVMKGAIGDHPLANASGTTVENISSMKPFVDCFLVSTGISRKDEGFPDELDPRLVSQLAEVLAT